MAAPGLWDCNAGRSCAAEDQKAAQSQCQASLTAYAGCVRCRSIAGPGMPPGAMPGLQNGHATVQAAALQQHVKQEAPRGLQVGGGCPWLGTCSETLGSMSEDTPLASGHTPSIWLLSGLRQHQCPKLYPALAPGSLKPWAAMRGPADWRL